MQNDAHECFMAIIDELEQKEGFGKKFASQFVGQSVSVIRCKKCSKEIKKDEKFFVLSLPLGGHKP